VDEEASGPADQAEAAPPEDAPTANHAGDDPSAPNPAASDAAGREDVVPLATGSGSGGDEIVDLPWDDDLPVALGEETEVPQPVDEVTSDDVGGDDRVAGDDAEALDHGHDGDDEGDDLGALDDGDRISGRRNALPRRVESWRSRSATGAIATALAMGLQQVFEPEKRRPAAVAEAPSDPYGDDDPIIVDYVPDDAPSTTVRVRPWLLEKGDPS